MRNMHMLSEIQSKLPINDEAQRALFHFDVKSPQDRETARRNLMLINVD